jgi:SAM-dependent methyltransferase
LDIACLEGLFAIELARRGAKVVAIEGREANLDKAEFVKDMLFLDDLKLVRDDVRNLSPDRYGSFDVVLCLGILYHLDIPDSFLFMQQVADVCRGFAVIDTEVTISPEKSYAYRGKAYWGKSRVEHNSHTTPAERRKSPWASLDNVRSFCFTRASLYNLLSDVGFTSVYECHNPVVEKTVGRITLLAIKGRKEALISSPLLNAIPERRWPERSVIQGNIAKLLSLVPEFLKGAVVRRLLS